MLTHAVTHRRGTQEDSVAVRALAIAELGRAPSVARLRELLSLHPSVTAWSADRLVGFVYGARVAPDVIEIANLLVAEAYRGAGIGSDLVGRFEQQARNEYKAVLAVTSESWPSRSEKRSVVPLYLRLGYERIYERPDSRTTLLVRELGVNG